MVLLQIDTTLGGTPEGHQMDSSNRSATSGQSNFKDTIMMRQISLFIFTMALLCADVSAMQVQPTVNQISNDSLKSQLEVIQKEFKSKLDSMTQPIKTEKNVAYEHYIKAEALRLSGLFENAVQEYHRAIFVNKNYSQAYKGLGILNKNTKNYDDAISNLQKSIEKMPFDKQTYNELAICYMDTNKLCCAQKMLKKAIKLDPNYIEPQFNLAVLHEIMNENDLAFATYQKIIEQRPSYLAAYNNMATLYLRSDEQKKALQIFKKLMDINPEYHRAYLGTALCYDKMNRFALAKKFYNKYLEMKPNSDNAFYIKERLKKMKSTSVADLALV
jgi:tetratricopeptide (TPR) repeat protein